jgi:hypothetical protein
VISGATVPASAWWVDGSVLAAVFFGGLLATAMNNIFLARANKRLGPLVATMYVPVQPLCTAVLDYIFLGDAFYLCNLVCGVGVITGLMLVKTGKVKELDEIGVAVQKSAADGDGEADSDALLAASARLVRRMSVHSGGATPTVESLLAMGDEEELGAVAAAPASASDAAWASNGRGSQDRASSRRGSLDRAPLLDARGDS